MQPSKSVLYCCLFFSVLACAALANNMNVTNVSLINVSGGTADVQFDISWSHSWRYTEAAAGSYITNHDAAWVFIKFRVGAEWQHAWLTSSGHVPSAGATIAIASNGGDTNIGAFVYRDADGHGDFVCTTMRLRWDFSKNGLVQTNCVDISVHAIEMVKIPEGRFALGSGGSESYHFYEYPDGWQVYSVTNAGAIDVGATTGMLYYTGGGGDSSGPVPAAFPNGFSTFYCMKYEITQGQYAQFLNYAPSGYDYQRYPDKYGQQRHTINLVNGKYTVDAPDRACNYLSWTDVAAYLDWSGLRPMTELEYEKACRGPLTPIPDEYPWGDTLLSAAIISYDGLDGSGTETAFPTNANCHYYQYQDDVTRYGPTRAGIFARPGTIRHQAGAGYYGVMELAGNVYEQIITIGNSAGRAFIGNHGDGSLQTLPRTWPVATGAGDRGGTYTEHRYSPQDHRLRTSDRTQAIVVAGRDPQSGGRGVRSAQ